MAMWTADRMTNCSAFRQPRTLALHRKHWRDLGYEIVYFAPSYFEIDRIPTQWAWREVFNRLTGAKR